MPRHIAQEMAPLLRSCGLYVDVKVPVTLEGMPAVLMCWVGDHPGVEPLDGDIACEVGTC